jgi:hypothetical protein
MTSPSQKLTNSPSAESRDIFVAPTINGHVCGTDGTGGSWFYFPAQLDSHKCTYLLCL